MTTLVTSFSEINDPLLHCQKCNYSTCKKFNYDKHLLTAKHNVGVGMSTVKIYTCAKCESTFKSRNGLWCHSKKCNVVNTHMLSNDNEELIMSDKEMIASLVKQNAELTRLLTLYLPSSS